VVDMVTLLYSPPCTSAIKTHKFNNTIMIHFSQWIGSR